MSEKIVSEKKRMHYEKYGEKIPEEMLKTVPKIERKPCCKGCIEHCPTCGHLLTESVTPKCSKCGWRKFF